VPEENHSFYLVLRILFDYCIRTACRYVIVSEGETMPRGRSAEDTAVLEMALVGYEIEKQRIDQKIADIRARLGQRGGASSLTAGAKQAGRKRHLSPEARRRIAAAQRKRWAEHRRKLGRKAAGQAKG
jgi:hypothetical protein